MFDAEKVLRNILALYHNLARDFIHTSPDGRLGSVVVISVWLVAENANGLNVALHSAI